MAASDELLDPSCEVPFIRAPRSLLSAPSPPAFSSGLLDSLAGTNEPASDPDAAEIREHILPHATEDLARVQAKLKLMAPIDGEPLSPEVAQLAAEKYRLISMVSQSRGLLSALRRFPAEILTEIFLHYCNDKSALAFNLGSGPWALSYVARSWRSITLSTPSVWSYYFLHSPERCPGGWRRLLSVMLNRAGTRPISVTICASSQDGDRHRNLHHLWYKFLATHSVRWRYLALKLDHGLADCISQRARLDLPLLTTIDLDFGAAEPFGFSPISVFKAAPKLKDVTLRSYEKGHISLPYSQLETVALYPYDARARQSLAEDIITRCTQLHSLALLPSLNLDRVAKPLRDLRGAPSIRVLRLRPAEFLFTPPCLEVLDIGHVTRFKEVISSLQQSRALLKELSLGISDRFFSLDELAAFLCRFPSLRRVHMTLERLFIPAELEQAVADTITKQILPTLPNITLFSVRFTYGLTPPRRFV